MDQKLLFLINREWTNPVLDRLMALMSSTAFWSVPLGILAVIVLAFGGFRARAFVVVLLLAFVVNDAVVGASLKRAVGRLRPHQSEFGIRQIELKRPVWKGISEPPAEMISLGTGRDQDGRSFPSNHASNTAAVALVTAMFYRRWGWLAFLPACGVAYSRVYTGSHWPSDVLAGVCLGLGVAFAVLVLAELLWRWLGTRVAPKWAAHHPSLLQLAA
jgi:undecaprenyl-diphosphatase